MSEFVFNKEKFLWFDLSSQNPKSLFIRCVDSRTDPAILFEGEMGEALTFSTPAAFIDEPMKDIEKDPFFITLEIALQITNIENIILFPHSICVGQKYVEKNHNLIPIKKRKFSEIEYDDERLIITSVNNIKAYLKFFDKKINISVCYIDLKTQKIYNYKV